MACCSCGLFFFFKSLHICSIIRWRTLLDIEGTLFSFMFGRLTGYWAFLQYSMLFLNWSKMLLLQWGSLLYVVSLSFVMVLAFKTFFFCPCIPFQLRENFPDLAAHADANRRNGQECSFSSSLNYLCSVSCTTISWRQPYLRALL